MIIDLTVLEEKRRANPCPCDTCVASSYDISEWRDKETGHIMQETTTCHDNCDLLIKWSKE